MNLQVWLGPHIDVPHLVIVFGTVPNVFHFSDLVPRRDLMTDVDYLERYYGRENDAWLALRGDDRFSWSVSHGTYMRAFNSPIANSYMATCPDDEAVEVLGQSVRERVDTWLRWVREATAGPRVRSAPTLRERDHLVRTLRLHAGPDERAVQAVPRCRAGRRAGGDPRRPRPDPRTWRPGA